MKKNCSLAFKRFLYEFNKEGRDRGEGFSRNAFSLLFGKDLRKAEDMLLDTIDEIRSVDALGFIKSKKAIPLLLDKYQYSHGSYKIALSNALHNLCVITMDDYIDILKQFLHDPDKHVKSDALAYLSEIKSVDIIDILKDIINNELDRNIISIAFDILLGDIFGLFNIESFFKSKYRALLLKIVNADDEIRAKALQEFNDIVAECNKKRSRWYWLLFNKLSLAEKKVLRKKGAYPGYWFF